MNIFRSYSSRETKALGSAHARRILSMRKSGAKRNAAIVLALTGELGSGKTTFAQGFLAGFRIRRRVKSPTFVLITKYKLPRMRNHARSTHVAWAYHIDAYRARKPQDFAALGIEEILHNKNNIVLIEWPEKLKKFLPESTAWIHFSHGKRASPNTRYVRIRGE